LRLDGVLHQCAGLGEGVLRDARRDRSVKTVWIWVTVGRDGEGRVGHLLRVVVDGVLGDGHRRQLGQADLFPVEAVALLEGDLVARAGA
jgi:hypothetical protein